MALIDKASLLMVPSVYEDGTLYNVLPSGNKAPDETGNHNGYDQTRADFTFSRGSNLSATRINSDGLIEKGRENIVKYSNAFNTGWDKDRILSTTSGQSGYDGTNNAWLILADSVNNNHQIRRSDSTLSGVQTNSVYAKYSGYHLQLRATGIGSTNIWVNFDLQNGTIGNSGGGQIDANIESIGDGWYRCSIIYNPSSASYIGIVMVQNPATDSSLPAFVGDLTSGIFIQNAQAEAGLVASSYLNSGATTATAGVLENTPRIDYSSGAGALLLEPQRTNSIANSEYTDGSNWSNEGSITDEENTSETTSPEGLYNAVKLVSANATSEQWIQTTGVQTTNATDCTISCFVKKSDYDYFHIRFTGINGAFAAGSVWFNIAEGSVGTKQTGISADIKDYGNGWYRISATKEATATTTAGIRFQLASSDNNYNVAGDGVKGTYIYGCQAEIGSHVSSYVPTYGSAATRGADSCSVTGASDVIGQTEGTLFVEFMTPETNSYFIHSVSDGTNNNKVQIEYNTTSDTLIGIVRVSGVTEVSISATGMTPNTRYKAAIAYKANDFVFYVNGTQKGTDTSGSVPSSMSVIHLGSQVGTFFESGEVYNATLFNERLSNTELATLTTL